MSDDEIKASAINFAKNNKKRIAKELTSIEKYKPDPNPVSVFMAGSPGAGKTEFSKSLLSIIEKIEKDNKRQVIRIDADEIRPLIPGYLGNNSSLFHGAVSLVVEKIHDYALHQKQNFIFDQTFYKYEKAVENIRRSLGEKRPCIIFYLYQDPKVAWDFTKAREVDEGRNIPKEAFIEQFLGARSTVIRVLKEFKGKGVVVFLVKKNFERNLVEDIVEIEYNDKQIDDHIGKSYTESELNEML